MGDREPGPSREISLTVLEERLGEANAANLYKFKDQLVGALQERYGISVGLFVVGGFTYAEFPYEWHTDVDVILATDDRSLLVPYQELPADAVDRPLGGKAPLWACPLSDRVAAVLRDLDEWKPRDSPPNAWRHGEALGREEFRMMAGRPNMWYRPKADSNALRIHLAVLYYNPDNFEKMKVDGSNQYTFSDNLEHERRSNNTFCLLHEPIGQ